MGTRGGFVVVALLAAACGGQATPSQEAAPAEAKAGPIIPIPDPTGGPPPWAGPYPASHPPLPLVAFQGGAVLLAPKVVSVDFAGDPLDGAIRAFTEGVGATAWWRAVREGYCDADGDCVGDLVTTAHVTLPPLDKWQKADGMVDSTISQASPLRTYVRSQIDAGLIPEPLPDTVLMLYFPEGFTVDIEDLEGCGLGGFAGYHDSMTRNDDGTGTQFSYVVIPRCSSSAAYLQKVASHELIEAATDPFRSALGYVIDDFLWSLLEGGEVADMCEDPNGGDDAIVENGLTLQRAWSNVAAKAGNNPCVPVPPGEVYFNASPSETTLMLAYGESATIEVDAFSDGPVDDWNVYAIDLAAATHAGEPYLETKLERPTANNGTRMTLTITVARPAPRSVVGAPFLIISQTPRHTHVWPAVVFGK